MNEQEKLLTAKTEDLLRLCDKHCEAQFSFFLNEAEQAVIKREIGDAYGYNCRYFGGYENAQRMVLGVFPQWEEADTEKFPIKAVKITKTYPKNLTHRDYLGSIMAHGITREQVGDIIVEENTAYAFMIADMAEFVGMNLTKIGNVGVKAQLVDLDKIPVPEQKYQIINAVAASQRLDAVVAAMLKLSRREAAALIAGGGVGVNHIVTENTSYMINDGDVISARGYGRFLFCGDKGETRSQRMHIVVKKYL